MSDGMSNGVANTPRAIWPELLSDSSISCAVLFIDIRGSSEMSAQPGQESSTVALRMKVFLSLTAEVWQELKGPQPSMVRSVGDGLLCVWELDRNSPAKQAETRSAILEAVLGMHVVLPGKLRDAWEFEADVKLGMGLATGDAAVARLGSLKDYYGYTVNLASKLQDFARPEGVVIDRSFVENKHSYTNGKDFKLEKRRFALPMVPQGALDCLVTRNVHEVHKWTCLAWPGFAISHGSDERRLGLNARGITVLTHEGIRGKIGSLEIWPRNDPRDDEGDGFELIIDDFDSLSEMHAEKAISLYNTKQDDRRGIAGALRVPTSEAGFYFKPIRCGVNGLAWHTEQGAAVAEHENYMVTIEAAGRHKLGLYDNMGATLPLLINAVLPNMQDVFAAHADDLNEVLKRLEAVQASLQAKDRYRRLFILHTTITKLADALQTGYVHAVIGGGAWLANPKRVASALKVDCGIPKGELARGFLWIEGAAVLERSLVHCRDLRHFLRESVLTPSYQRDLMHGDPYGCSPVSGQVLTELLDGTSESCADPSEAMQMTIKETRSIFRGSPDQLNPKVLVRRQPDDPRAWNDAWLEIRERFCKQH